MNDRQYRTREQFQEIVDNMDNGNWQDAGKLCNEYGFWASDIHTALQEYDYMGNVDPTDFIYLVEIAMQDRQKNGLR